MSTPGAARSGLSVLSCVGPRELKGATTSPTFAAACDVARNCAVAVGLLAIRLIRKEPVPKEAILRTVVVDKGNVEPYTLPVEKRTCPTMDAAVAN